LYFLYALYGVPYGYPLVPAPSLPCKCSTKYKYFVPAFLPFGIHVVFVTGHRLLGYNLTGTTAKITSHLLIQTQLTGNNRSLSPVWPGSPGLSNFTISTSFLGEPQFQRQGPGEAGSRQARGKGRKCGVPRRPSSLSWTSKTRVSSRSAPLFCGSRTGWPLWQGARGIGDSGQGNRVLTLAVPPYCSKWPFDGVFTSLSGPFVTLLGVRGERSLLPGMSSARC
jgi:hypothetical protein